MKNIVKIITTSLLIFILGVFFVSLNRNTSYDTEYLVGNKLTEVRIESFDRKTFYTDNEFKNNAYTLINFWASWCSPCRIEHPILMKLSKEKRLKIFGINFKDKKENAKTFLDQLGNPYSVLARDKNGKQSVKFGIYGIPESILINNDLIILKKYIGPLNLEDFNEIKNILKNSLNQK